MVLYLVFSAKIPRPFCFLFSLYRTWRKDDLLFCSSSYLFYFLSYLLFLYHKHNFYFCSLVYINIGVCVCVCVCVTASRLSAVFIFLLFIAFLLCSFFFLLSIFLYPFYYSFTLLSTTFSDFYILSCQKIYCVFLASNNIFFILSIS